MVSKRRLGSTELMVSELGLGALEIGRDWAPDVNADSRHLTQGEASRVLNAVLDMGINFIDTAPAYWYSEEFIGKALSSRREEYILATKVGEHCDPAGSVYDYSAAATANFVDQSLKRLQTDYIDLLQIHSASMEVLERGETLQAMQEAQRQGKALHLGMTGGVAECIRALELGGFETVQFPYNLLNLAAEERLLDLAREKDAGVIIMRGLAGGKLTRKHLSLEKEELRSAISGIAAMVEKWEHDKNEDALAGVAIRYVLARPEVSSVIVGSRRTDAIAANLRAAQTPLQEMAVGELRSYLKGLPVTVW